MTNNFKTTANDTRKRVFWGRLLALYFVVDYCRPQDIISILSYARVGMILSIFFIYYLMKNLPLIDSKAKELRLMAYFIVLMATYIPFAHNGFFAYRETKSVLLFFPVMSAMVLLLDSQQSLRKLFHLQGFISVWLAGWGLLHNGRGPGSFLEDENDLALYAVCWLPFFIYLFLSASNKREALQSSIYVGSAIVIVVITSSRGGFLGLVSVALVYWWYSRYKFRISIAFLIAVAVALALIDPSYWQEMGTISDTSDDTANERILSWRAAGAMFMDNPLGVGAGNFRVLFHLYQPEELTRNMWGRAAHSLWFTLLPELGIIGIVIYFRMILNAYSNSRWIKKQSKKQGGIDRSTDELATACLAAMAGFFAAATFISVLYYKHFFYLIVIIYCAKSIYETQLQTRSASADSSAMTKSL